MELSVEARPAWNHVSYQSRWPRQLRLNKIDMVFHRKQKAFVVHLSRILLLILLVTSPGKLFGQNVALNKPASSSSVDGEHADASRVVDGISLGKRIASSQNSVCQTKREEDPWWEVDLGASYDISAVKVWRRTDDLRGHLNDCYILVSDRPISDVGMSKDLFFSPQRLQFGENPSVILKGNNKKGRYIRVVNFGKSQVLSLAEVEVYVEDKFAFLDYSKMIPLRKAATERTTYMGMELTGGAIKAGTTAVLRFDTGSWTLALKRSQVDMSKVKVLKRDTKDGWGETADLVIGPLGVKSTDGTTLYMIEDYKFFVKDKGSRYLVGAFPSDIRVKGEPFTPFPLALARKYAGGKGFGIVSTAVGKQEPDINKGWENTSLYLQLGPYEGWDDTLNWASHADMKRLLAKQRFSTIIPSFSVTLRIPESGKEIHASDRLAFIDTGAPQMKLRFEGDPQYDPPFAAHFIKERPPWVPKNKSITMHTFVDGTVTVDFFDENQQKCSYSFPVPKAGLEAPIRKVRTGPWDGDFAVTAAERRGLVKKGQKFNLGISILYFCPVYYIDIENRRFGFGFYDSRISK